MHVKRTGGLDYLFKTELVFANYKKYYKNEEDNEVQFLLLESQLTDVKFDEHISNL